jgi:ferric-dicitrate binding protein FerR (iron transport regulator)
MSIPQHIIDRLEDYLDGNLNQSGHDFIAKWSDESGANREALAAWFLSQVELFEASRLADMRNVFAGFAFDGHATDAAPALRTAKQQRWSRRSIGRAIAASVIIAGIAGYLWTTVAKNNNGIIELAAPVASTGQRRAAEQPPSPALLSRLFDCVWARDMKPLRVGQDIAAGTIIDIQSGLAQLVFESGAEVVLKGPCRLRVDTSMLCQLFSGNVSAEVPHRAAGFTIRGPTSEVIDLGTRFGFSVSETGNSEVHVFQGEVISRQLDERGEVIGSDIRLKTNQAVLFPGEKKQAQRLAANEAKFALEVKPLWLNDKIEPLAIDRNIALWLRAGHGVQTDRKNRVVAWQDLTLGSNRIANDAFQPDAKARPLFSSDTLNGHPGIQFDGAATYLTTTPVTTTNDQTLVVVFQYAEPNSAAGQIGGQIVNYNGPPSRYLPDIHSPGVLQLGEKIDSWNGPQFSIAAKSFVGHDSRGADVSAGIVRSKSLGHDRPRVVSYVYNNSKNVASLFVDGIVVEESSAPTRVAVTSRKVIGKHGIFDQWYFHGDLSELIIFNTALRQSEVNTLSRQLMQRYGIEKNNAATL